VAIVVRARESRVQGEGPHRERRVRSHPVGCEGLGILADADRALRPLKASQGVAGCGESRTYGDNGGDGKTQSGCASCPYPLKSWQQIFLGVYYDVVVLGASEKPEPVRSDG
jgi:hypothetical protein